MYLEVHFSNRLPGMHRRSAVAMAMVVPIIVTVPVVATLGTINPFERLLADHDAPLLSLGIDINPIGAMNLVIGENPVLKNEPPRSPSFAVIDPFVENSRDFVMRRKKHFPE